MEKLRVRITDYDGNGYIHMVNIDTREASEIDFRQFIIAVANHPQEQFYCKEMKLEADAIVIDIPGKGTHVFDYSLMSSRDASIFKSRYRQQQKEIEEAKRRKALTSKVTTAAVSKVTGTSKVEVLNNGKVVSLKLRVIKPKIDEHFVERYGKEIKEKAHKELKHECERKGTAMAPLSMYTLDNIELIDAHTVEVRVRLKKELSDYAELIVALGNKWENTRTRLQDIDEIDMHCSTRMHHIVCRNGLMQYNEEKKVYIATGIESKRLEELLKLRGVGINAVEQIVDTLANAVGLCKIDNKREDRKGNNKKDADYKALKGIEDIEKRYNEAVKKLHSWDEIEISLTTRASNALLRRGIIECTNRNSIIACGLEETTAEELLNTRSIGTKTFIDMTEQLEQAVEADEKSIRKIKNIKEDVHNRLEIRWNNAIKGIQQGQELRRVPNAKAIIVLESSHLISRIHEKGKDGWLATGIENITLEELESLRHMGAVTLEKIVEWVERNSYNVEQ